MGMTKYIVDAVQGSRINDLLTGLGYRWIVVYFNLTGKYDAAYPVILSETLKKKK